MSTAWAEPFIGLPYEINGRSDKGVDCWGLVCMVFERVRGITLPLCLDCYKTPDFRGAIREEIERYSRGWEIVPEGAERPFDCILLRIMGFPMHVGIVVTPGLMLHIKLGTNAAAESYRTIGWRHRVLGFYRYAWN